MRSFNNALDKLKWAGIFLLMLMPAITYGQVNISLPDTTLRAGETINVPIYVTEISDTAGVVSGEFEFEFNNSYFDITGVNRTGTLLESVSNTVYFEGTDRLAFSSSDTVSGSGVLVYLKVKAYSEVDYFRNSSLQFVTAKFNEGVPSVSTENGSLRTLGVRISPKNNIQITEGDTLQFNLLEDATAPINWSVTDTNIGQIDSNGQFVANTTGTVQVKGVDATGLRDSTSFFTILPDAFTDLTLSIPDTSTTETLTLDLPVRSSDLTGIGVRSIEMDISFSESYLTLEEVLTTPRTEGWGDPAVNIDNNRVQIAAAGTDSLKGSGDLYILRFQVTNNLSGNSSVSFNTGLLNENLQADLVNSTVTVNNAPDILVSPQDTAVSIGNSIQFEVTGGNGTAPYSWETSDASVASVSSSGLLEGATRGDVVIHAIDAQGFPSDPINVEVNDFDAYLDSLELTYPDTATVGLFTAEELSSYSIIAFESEVRYDTTKLQFAGLDLTNTQASASGLNVEARDSANFVKIAAAGTNQLSGTEPLVKLRFAPKTTVQDAENIKLNLMELSFNEPSPAVPTTTPLPGLITISRISPPAAPSLVSPVDNAADTDTSVAFSWASLAEADQYKFQLSQDPTFATTLSDSTISDSSLTLGSLDFSSEYYWRVAGINTGGQGSWSGVRSFTSFSGLPETVTLVNPGDQEINVDTALTFMWNEASLAKEYQYQLSMASDFSVTIVDSMLADTSIAFNLDNDSQYYWRVRSSNEQGNASWSSTRSFTTIVKAPEVPQLKSPANGTVDANTTLQLIWFNSLNADSFRVEVSTDSLFNTFTVNEITSDTMLTVSSLALQTKYFWRVLAKNVSGESGYSSVNRFTTYSQQLILQIPDLLEPGNDSIDLPDSLQFIWSQVHDAEEYDFELDPDTSTVNRDLVTTTSDTTVTVSNLAFNTTYFWRVKSKDLEDSRESEWSSWFEFTVEEAPNQPPVVLNPLGSISLQEDFADTTIADLSQTFSDPEGQVLDFVIESNTDLVTAQLTGTNLIVSSLADTNGTGQVVIKATDDLGQQVLDTLNIEVTPVNDLPFVTQLSDSISFVQGETLSFSIDTSFSDIEDQLSDLTFSLTIDPSDITLSFDPNTYIVTLESQNYTGSGNLSITVTDSDGGSIEVNVVVNVEMSTSNELQRLIPEDFSLNQNYPNPFNPSSTIRFGVPEAAEVRLNVYNMLGQKVAALVNKKMQAGWHTVEFDASGLSTGTYIYRIQAGSFTQTKMMMLIK